MRLLVDVTMQKGRIEHSQSVLAGMHEEPIGGQIRRGQRLVRHNRWPPHTLRQVNDAAHNGMLDRRHTRTYKNHYITT
jgi:hypothetical protein